MFFILLDGSADGYLTSRGRVAQAGIPSPDSTLLFKKRPMYHEAIPVDLDLYHIVGDSIDPACICDQSILLQETATVRQLTYVYGALHAATSW